jgi:F0F1-type ATP synthase membrane subunit a
LWDYLDNIVWFFITSWWFELSTLTPLMRGVLLQIILILLIIFSIKFFRKTKFWIWFSLIFEYMYEFFEEILGKNQKKIYKVYVVSLFFVLLLSNLLSYVIDLIRIVFTDIDALTEIVVIPTTNFNFNLAVALISILTMLYVQFRRAGIINFFLEYVPITGKGILDIERW